MFDREHSCPCSSKRLCWTQYRCNSARFQSIISIRLYSNKMSVWDNKAESSLLQRAPLADTLHFEERRWWRCWDRRGVQFPRRASFQPSFQRIRSAGASLRDVRCGAQRKPRWRSRLPASQVVRLHLCVLKGKKARKKKPTPGRRGGHVYHRRGDPRRVGRDVGSEVAVRRWGGDAVMR